MDKHLPFWLRRVMYNLRGGFLLRPLIIALSLGCAGASLSWLEQTLPGLADLVPVAIFPSHSDPQVAQVILGGIASSIMTVVSIVFAILLMTLTLSRHSAVPSVRKEDESLKAAPRSWARRNRGQCVFVCPRWRNS